MNYYDTIAPIYEEARWMSEAVAEKVATVMLEVLEANPSISFLEPGVGTGVNVFPLVKRGYSATGIDVSQNMFNQFRQKFSGFLKNVTLLRMDASNLSFWNGSFDVVLTAHMIHTVSDWNSFLNEIERVLKPQGFYLNAQWTMPPHRMKFDGYFRSISINMSHYQASWTFQLLRSMWINSSEKKIGNQLILLLTNDLQPIQLRNLSYYQSRSYGICWQIPDNVYHQVMKDFEKLCIRQYGSLKAE